MPLISVFGDTVDAAGVGRGGVRRRLMIVSVPCGFVAIVLCSWQRYGMCVCLSLFVRVANLRFQAAVGSRRVILDSLMPEA